jgi:hypothetical protein
LRRNRGKEGAQQAMPMNRQLLRYHLWQNAFRMTVDVSGRADQRSTR